MATRNSCLASEATLRQAGDSIPSQQIAEKEGITKKLLTSSPLPVSVLESQPQPLLYCIILI